MAMTPIKISDYSQLRLIAWNRDPKGVIEGADALALYEANWRFVDQDALDDKERALIEWLTVEFGKGVFCGN